ncbi:MAG: potassium transporter Kup [Candidatus Zixiibacteriota bacterium]
MTDDSPAPKTADARKRLAILALAALGVVYGDIGTSPLYAMRECFHGDFEVPLTRANVLGILSLMVWALILIVAIKYLTFILRADNRGEGGVIALTALVRRALGGERGWRWPVIAAGVFAASLLYGDGMITPAISVLSAVEGLRVVTPVFDPYIVPLTVGILLALFMVQSHGTQRVGVFFGPITLTWFCVIMLLGLPSIVQRPEVLMAFSPIYGFEFLRASGKVGFLALGAVFLVVTGAETLYADLGHFGRRPIRLAWFTVAMPALLCNYMGQGAALLGDPTAAANPFYALAPRWALMPLVVLATVATIIASQAVITGAFSLTRQAIQMGYLPRLRIIHTSAAQIGQVYVPQVNWILMICTVALVLGFGSSSRLAAAYGVAVTTTMLIATILYAVVARLDRRWRWPAVLSFALVFIAVDLSFFGANISKIAHGAWIPLAIAAAAFTLMSTWRKGRAILTAKLYAGSPTLETFLDDLHQSPPLRIPGKAIFMAGRRDVVPPALVHNLRHNRVLHQEVAIMNIRTEDVPSVPSEERVTVEELGDGFWRIVARYGFMETPDVCEVLDLARKQGLEFEPWKVSFFLGRERVRSQPWPLMSLWRKYIFSFLLRNAQGATTYFNIPPERVIEIGEHVSM